MTTVKRLKGPVGIRKGLYQVTNLIDDQQSIMALLDDIRLAEGGNLQPDGEVQAIWPLPTPGKCNIVLWCGLLRFQNAQYAAGSLPFEPDGVADPDGVTYKLMVEVRRHVPPMTAGNPRRVAMETAPIALSWVNECIRHLKDYRDWLTKPEKRVMITREAFDPVYTHLKFGQLSDQDAVRYTDTYIQNYTLMASIFNRPDAIFKVASIEDQLRVSRSNSCFGLVMPAWAIANNAIWFGPDFIGLGPKCRTAILIHECGHYIHPSILHEGGERGPEYDSLRPEVALRSAYVYANFASHVVDGWDARHGLARPLD